MGQPVKHMLSNRRVHYNVEATTIQRPCMGLRLEHCCWAETPSKPSSRRIQSKFRSCSRQDVIVRTRGTTSVTVRNSRGLPGSNHRHTPNKRKVRSKYKLSTNNFAYSYMKLANNSYGHSPCLHERRQFKTSTTRCVSLH